MHSSQPSPGDESANAPTPAVVLRARLALRRAELDAVVEIRRLELHAMEAEVAEANANNSIVAEAPAERLGVATADPQATNTATVPAERPLDGVGVVMALHGRPSTEGLIDVGAGNAPEVANETVSDPAVYAV